MQTQITLGNLKAQPAYGSFVVQTYAKEAMGK